jgi:hypothetical protein
MDWLGEIADRARAHAGGVALTPAEVVVVLVVALAVVLTPTVWRVVRLGVTLVHELGHGVVGVAAGRQFTGFVLRGDMSGHAVTRGPARGLGRVASTWAGYPTPAVLGAGIVWAADRGWAPTVLTVLLVVLLLALVRVRSVLTVLVVLAALVGLGALWWWRADTVQAQALLGLGMVLVVGAWRHLLAVLGDRSAGSDPVVLAALTHVPRVVWNATFVLVVAGASALVGAELVTALA